MGLDWIPGGRPKPGHEAELEAIIRRMAAGDYADKAFEDADAERYDEISVSALETLKAPQVGLDAAATDWARKLRTERQIKVPEEEWLRKMEGFYVVALVPPCDGIPRYSNGTPGGYVERYSFRAQLLSDCLEIIDDELFDTCFQTMTVPETRLLGEALLEAGQSHARSQRLDLVNLDTSDMDGVGFKLDVVLSAGRWCLFWAERDHHLHAWW